MKRPLPILKSTPGQYAAEDIPRGIDVDICPVCNTSHCKVYHKPVHPEGEE
jgi:hypothetical protein